MDQLKLKLREYYQRIQEQQPGDGKGKAKNAVLELENDILTQFGLPVSKRFVQILHDFTDHSQVNDQLLDYVSKKLRAAARKYLLAPVMSDQEQLNHARDQKRNPHDVLPELGYPGHEYALFLVGELLYRRNMAVADILDELKKVERHQQWDNISEVAKAADATNHPLYEKLQKLHLRFVDEFAQYARRKTVSKSKSKRTTPAEEGYKPNFHTIVKAQVEDIVFDEKTPPRLYGKMKIGARLTRISVGLEFSELNQLLAAAGEMGEKIGTLLKKRMGTQNGQPVVIDIRSEFGEVLKLDDCYLEVYKPQQLVNGKWVEEKDAFYYVERILSKKEVEKRVKEEDTKQKIQECLELVGGSYVAYQRLRRLGITEDEAKLRAGLQDELLFKLSFYLHKLKD
ncbi:hypothetical protein MKQ68_13210 [Chitinophaga horti]|uniref:Uncharacterized protein n=1 Tax=Chitinophaga horti TaxID=2920382 RepID=A0ABY6IUK1_9BACT|nr:hypothetical protein [Chitinophaga horti]UYQ91053.1 hypothetical protein MKQ68_13210 [Chitinophaga horti]